MELQIYIAHANKLNWRFKAAIMMHMLDQFCDEKLISRGNKFCYLLADDSHEISQAFFGFLPQG